MGKSVLVALGMTAAIIMASSSAFAAGDAKKGAKVFKKCKACHSVKPGKHKVGPSLSGVVGRKAGTATGFKKYRGLKKADWSWDEKMLDEWLANPKKFAKSRGRKTSMVFKLKKAKQRANVIAYLKSI
jgi:cytochrome c